MSQMVANRNALRVLVVEDEMLQRWMLSEQLKDLGIGQVIEAEDGSEALHRFQEQRFDLVITDLNMPGMDGVGFLRVLVALRWQCPVVITSALQDDLLRLVEEALAESGSQLLAVLPKPLDADRLEALVDQAAAVCNMHPEVPRHHLRVGRAEVYEALAAGVFEPHFQPKIDVGTGRAVALEALARWQHESKGWISPVDFIPILEGDQGIIDLTMLLLNKVCDGLRRLDREGFRLNCAVNLSRSLFGNAGVVEQISGIIEAMGMAPDRFTLEITETAVDSDPGNMLASLARLKMKGFRLSIDDFGTGYSSMQALVRVPFDELKVDRSFVTGATHNRRSRIVLESTLQLAARLGQTTVAEGVETSAELALLNAAGCDLVQGYFFSRPLPESQLLAWLRRQPAMAAA